MKRKKRFKAPLFFEYIDRNVAEKQGGRSI